MAKSYPMLKSFKYDSKIDEVEATLKTGNYVWKFDENEISWLPLAGKVGEDDLKKLRENILEFAKAENLEDLPKNRKTRFDLKLGLKLLEWIDMSPSVASEPEIWAYLNIVLIPDIIKMRWDKEEKVINRERYYDKTRNYLGKLWWGAYLSTSNDDRLFEYIKEHDEFDAFFDRANSRGYNGYINVVYKVFDARWDSIKEEVKQERTRFFREVIIKICKKFAYLNYYALAEADLQSITGKIIDELVAKKKTHKLFVAR